jgi:hypothetical protein
MQLEGVGNMCAKFSDVTYEGCSGMKSEIMSNESEGKSMNLLDDDDYDDEYGNDNDGEPPYLTSPTEGNGFASQWLSSVNSFSMNNLLTQGSQTQAYQCFQVYLSAHQLMIDAWFGYCL